MPYVIPFRVNPHEYSLFVVLQEDSLDRMRQYDPAEVNIPKLQHDWVRLKLRDIILAYATDDDWKTAMGLFEAGEPQAAMRFLSRGFRYRPEQGDHDDPYRSLKP